MLADNGYTTIFYPHSKVVTVYDSNDVKLNSFNQPLLQGWRNADGLWMVLMADDNMPSPSLDLAETVMNVYELPSTTEVVRFLHAALGFPSKATLLTAAQHGNLVTFPGLTTKNISMFFPESDETQKGQMKQQKQGVISMKVVDETAALQFKPILGVKHKDVYLHMFNTTKKAMYSDQTGHFPITLSHGNKYLMTAVELDGNYIDADPIQ